MKNNNWRNTSQFLIPSEKNTDSQSGEYDIYPSFKLGRNSIFEGFDSLAAEICNEKLVIIDGYVGVFYDEFRDRLNNALIKLGKKISWQGLSKALKSPEEIDSIIAPYLGGDDPLFGKRTGLSIFDFFEENKIKNINPDPAADINILMGPGAGMVDWDATLLYIDLPKNELQFRARSKTFCNLGASEPFDTRAMYKRFYFVDWVVLNKHKKSIQESIDIVIDGQRPEQPVWTSGKNLNVALREMSQNYFRVRPWFEPGTWGGNWMKDNIPGLNKDVPNYAWSFELIVPENGLLLEDNGLLLEISFDFLMFQEGGNILGEAHKRFGHEFPIRFDFLDTFDGGNLSIQCHPSANYTKQVFGEDFTQDETYYILDTKDNAKVYLGFQEDIDEKQFREVLKKSFEESTPIDMDKYVQTHPANKHDLFLIPNQTIHGSGTNNMVLEISSTPYIFTFKLYDWIRPDLDGKPRPLNIERGFKNLDFSRKGEKVKKEHISKPALIKEGADWKLYHLPTHPEHFYDVHRYEFDTVIEVNTENQCHIMMLVEGESIILETSNGLQQVFNYAETFVIPAAANSYKLRNIGNCKAKVVKAFVKGTFV